MKNRNAAEELFVVFLILLAWGVIWKIDNAPQRLRSLKSHLDHSVVGSNGLMNSQSPQNRENHQGNGIGQQVGVIVGIRCSESSQDDC